MILTDRLQLVPATLALAAADLEGSAALERHLGAKVPESWPPDLYDATAVEYTLRQLREHPEQAGWSLRYFVRAAPGQAPVLIGVGGYKGAPDAEGTVEIGYSVLPEYRRQGYAAEAALGMAAYAFAFPEVTHVIAETLPELYPSIGVLKKCGFAFQGPGSEKGVVRYALTRADYERR